MLPLLSPTTFVVAPSISTGPGEAVEDSRDELEAAHCLSQRETRTAGHPATEPRAGQTPHEIPLTRTIHNNMLAGVSALSKSVSVTSPTGKGNGGDGETCHILLPPLRGMHPLSSPWLLV